MPQKSFIFSLFLLFHFISYTQTTREWVGSGNWSSTVNWSPAGSPSGTRLLWNNNGNISSNNDLNGLSSMRLQFSPLALQTYTITGNQISLEDATSGSRGLILNESSFLQNILAPVLFNENSKAGYITTISTGKLFLGDITLGGNASSSLRFAGEQTDGAITISGNLTSSNIVTIGIDDVGSGTAKPNTRVFFTNNNPGFSGTLRITSGVLNLQNSGAAGYSATNLVDILNGGSVELQGNISIDNLNGKRFKVTGNGPVNGAIRNVSGNNSVLSDIFLSGNTRIGSDADVLTIGNIGKNSGTTTQRHNAIFAGTGNIVLMGTLGQITLTDNSNLGNLTKTGTGTLTLNNKCYFLGGTNINSGGKVTLGMNNALPETSNLTLNDGSLNTGPFSQNLGTLNLTGNSTINLGSTNSTIVRFAASQGISWTAGRILTITGWDGEEGLTAYPGSSKIYIGMDPSGLTEAQLAQIVFVRPNGVSFCQGAALLGDGELVPAKRPFITSVTGSQPHTSSLLSFAGYVGSTITVSGCQFFGATSVMVGTTQILSFLESGNNITFTLPDNVSGIISITTAGGSRSSSTSLLNLGYIAFTTPANSSGTNWNTAALWQGTTIPPANRPVTIAFNSVIANSLNNLNGKSITITSGSQETALRLFSNNLIQSNTPLILSGGNLRVMNANSNSNTSATGFSQTFASLSVQANSTIALDNRASGTFGSLVFGSSRNLTWAPGATLTIANWAGSEGASGTKYKIFVTSPDGINPGLTADQLRQIKFTPYCQGATILMPSGELVPAGSPYISSITSLPGNSNFAYYGSTIRLTGCKFTDVTEVKVGTTVIDPASITITGDSQLDFIYTESLNIDKITLTTSAAKIGISADSIKKLGYISTASGDWNNKTSWQGGYFPVSGQNITIANQVNVNTNLSIIPDTLFVNSGGMLNWSNNGLLPIGKALIISSGGSVFPTQPGTINVSDNGVIENNGTFNSNNNLTTNFLGNGTISGTQPITFHNLTINSGILTLPLNVGVNPPFPLITNEFRINGGALASTLFTNVGPRYGSNSSLVYSSGLYQRRFREWLGNPGTNQSAGVPYNVVVENGTDLVLDGQTTGLGNPSRLRCLGNFIIKNGSVRVDLTVPLEIAGNLQLGNGSSNIGVLNMGRISASEDPNFPTVRLNFSDNYLIIQGSYIRNQNSSFNYRMNRQPINFEGNNPAIIDFPGISIPVGDTAQSFYSFIINKNADLTLKNSIGILDSIVLNYGKIITSGSSFVRIEADGKSLGGNDQSFVSGQLKKVTGTSSFNASSDFTFHVGKIEGGAPVYRPVKVANLTHSGTTTYSAEYFSTQTNASPFDPVFADYKLLGIWKWQWWEIGKSGSGQARVGIPYAPGSTWTTDPCSTCKVGVARYNGSSWEFTEDQGLFGNSGNTYPEALRNDTSAYVYSDLMSNFSPYTVGWGQANILPIKLLYFNGNLSGNDVLLKWKIANSTDLRHFVVEHSLDGRNFSELGKVLWAENKEFGWRHIGPGPGVHFYRLQMVEKSGARSYSPVEMVQIGVNRTIIEGLAQNPVTSGVAMVKVYSAISQKAEVSVFDMAGRLVFRQQFALIPGKNNSPVSLLPLSAGQYRMLVSTADGVEKTLQVMK